MRLDPTLLPLSDDVNAKTATRHLTRVYWMVVHKQLKHYSPSSGSSGLHFHDQQEVIELHGLHDREEWPHDIDWGCTGVAAHVESLQHTEFGLTKSSNTSSSSSFFLVMSGPKSTSCRGTSSGIFGSHVSLRRVVLTLPSRLSVPSSCVTEPIASHDTRCQ